MRKISLLATLGISSVVFATNGDLLIGVGPVSRAMGGVGIGLPTDADSVIFSNPALMSAFKRTTFSFGGTLFMPHTKGYTKSALNKETAASAKSNSKYFAIPSIAIIYPLNQSWTFGIAAYGISGMGVDYRNTKVDCGSGKGCYTNFQMMEVSPSVAYKMGKFSFGAGLDLTYGALDLGNGMGTDYGVGIQIGASYRVNSLINLGLVYKSPISMTYPRVMDFNRDGTLDSMKLQQPQQVGLGVGITPNESISIGADLVWVNWKNAKGYKDFNWDNQWVFKIGGQYKVNNFLTLRAGYNYGKSPVKGRYLNLPNDPQKAGQMEAYECMRIIGFPAIVEQHLTLGAGFQLTKNLRMDLSYIHAFSKTVESKANNGDYWKSKLSEDSVSIGLTWSF